MKEKSVVVHDPILSFSTRSGVPVYASFDQLAADYGCSGVSIRKIALAEGVNIVKFHGDARYFVQVDAFRKSAEGKYRCCQADSCKTYHRAKLQEARLARYAESAKPDPSAMSPRCQEFCRTCDRLPHCIIVFGAEDMAKRLSDEMAKEVGHK